jgi:hypothetical protein
VELVGFAAGTITDAQLIAGGAEQSPRIVAVTEYWNGTSWTEVNDMGVNQQVDSDQVLEEQEHQLL